MSEPIRSAACPSCRKTVLRYDPKEKLGSAVYHKACAKCAMCACALSNTNFVNTTDVSHGGQEEFLLCKKDYSEVSKEMRSGHVAGLVLDRAVSGVGEDENSLNSAPPTLTLEPPAVKMRKYDMRRTFSASNRCPACDVMIYTRDPQINFDGKVYHTACAKCKDCGASLSLRNFRIVDEGSSKVLMCEPHYKRLLLQASSAKGSGLAAKRASVRLGKGVALAVDGEQCVVSSIDEEAVSDGMASSKSCVNPPKRQSSSHSMSENQGNAGSDDTRGKRKWSSLPSPYARSRDTLVDVDRSPLCDVSDHWDCSSITAGLTSRDERSLLDAGCQTDDGSCQTDYPMQAMVPMTMTMTMHSSDGPSSLALMAMSEELEEERAKVIALENWLSSSSALVRELQNTVAVQGEEIDGLKADVNRGAEELLVVLNKLGAAVEDRELLDRAVVQLGKHMAISSEVKPVRKALFSVTSLKLD